MVCSKTKYFYTFCTCNYCLFIVLLGQLNNNKYYQGSFMNHLNPRAVKDHARYNAVLKTEFAKQNFWRLRDSLGHKFWSKVQGAIEDNLSCEGYHKSIIATVSRVRRLKLENEWRNREERLRGLGNDARADLLVCQAQKIQADNNTDNNTENPTFAFEEQRVIYDYANKFKCNNLKRPAQRTSKRTSISQVIKVSFKNRTL